MQRAGSKKVLTIKFVETGKYPDGGRGNGLYPIVEKRLIKWWEVPITANGVRRTYGIGSAKEVSLAEARARAEETRDLARAGRDSKSARQEDEILNFAQAAEIDLEQRVKPTAKGAKACTQWIEPPYPVDSASGKA